MCVVHVVLPHEYHKLYSAVKRVRKETRRFSARRVQNSSIRSSRQAQRTFRCCTKPSVTRRLLRGGLSLSKHQKGSDPSGFTTTPGRLPNPSRPTIPHSHTGRHGLAAPAPAENRKRSRQTPSFRGL